MTTRSGGPPSALRSPASTVGACATRKRASGCAAATRAAASRIVGSTPLTSWRRLPGTSPTTGASPSTPSSLRASARAGASDSASSTGWPTNATGTPARRYSAVSNGNTASTSETTRRMSRTRHGRHAQICGGRKYATATPARRAARASRRLNSGKSITTRTSGRPDPVTAARSRRYARYRPGTPATASVPPTVAAAVTSTSSSTPSAAMRRPPMPVSRAPGAAARSARASVAPCRSPEASPATIIMERGRSGAGVTRADQRDGRGVGAARRRLPLEHEHALGLERDDGGAALGGRLDRFRADRRHVEAKIVLAAHRLDDHGARAAQRGAATDGRRRPLDRLHRAHRAPPDDDRLPDAPVGGRARDGEAAPHVRPLVGGRRPRPEHDLGGQPGAEERPLIEQLDAHSTERGQQHALDVAVEQAAGAPGHRT